MSRTRKYRRGDLIPTAMDAIDEILNGRCVFWNNKPVHPAWAMGWNLVTISNATGRHLYFAHRTENVT